MAIKYSNPVNLSVIGAQSINGNLSLGFQTIINETVLASAKVPAETFKNKSQIVYSFLFRNDILFQTGKQLKALDTGALFTSSLSSKVLAVSVGKEKIENLTLPVLFTFKKIEKIPPKETQIVDDICTFWDPEIRKLTTLLNNHFVCQNSCSVNFVIICEYIQTIWFPHL